VLSTIVTQGQSDHAKISALSRGHYTAALRAKSTTRIDCCQHGLPPAGARQCRSYPQFTRPVFTAKRNALELAESNGVSVEVEFVQQALGHGFKQPVSIGRIERQCFDGRVAPRNIPTRRAFSS
jgi:hypothetical protein